MTQKALVELTCGIIRVGPEHTAYHLPYEFAAMWVANEGVCEVKGLVRPRGLIFTREHFVAGHEALSALGLTVKWKRPGLP